MVENLSMKDSMRWRVADSCSPLLRFAERESPLEWGLFREYDRRGLDENFTPRPMTPKHPGKGEGERDLQSPPMVVPWA